MHQKQQAGGQNSLSGQTFVQMAIPIGVSFVTLGFYPLITSFLNLLTIASVMHPPVVTD